MARRLQTQDLVVARFPAHTPPGHEQHGVRPAVVVALLEPLGETRYPIVFLAPLTTHRNQEWVARSPGVYPTIPAGVARLPSDSVVLLDQIRAVGLQRVIVYRGRLSDEEYAPIRQGIDALSCT